MPDTTFKEAAAPKKDHEPVLGAKTGDAKTADKKHVHYTLIIRLPFPRGDFIDPPPVNWDTVKDRKLWKVISKLSNAGGASSTSASEGGASSEVDWDAKAADFGVDTRFLLQQAAWLWERHREHVKKHFVRVRAGSTTSTPVPGQTSVLGKKPGPSSRAPSSLSVRSRDSPLPRIDTTLASTAQMRPSTLSRTPSGATVTQSRQIVGAPSPKPQSLRAPTIRKQPSSTLRSPTIPDESPPASSSSSEDSSEADVAKMSRSIAAFRRPPRFAAKRQSALSKLGNEGDDEEDEESEEVDDEPTFYSTAQLGGDGAHAEKTDRGMGDTLRELASYKGKQLIRDRAATIEKPAPNAEEPLSRQPKQTKQVFGQGHHASKTPVPIRDAPTESSASSLSSANAPTSAPRTDPPARRTAHPLSPRHRANLARLSSPRRGEISDGTPSMGSSFSDLDVDASVTQSALEEALASNLRNGGSRLSNISNAFKSRYM